jgi:hypothetical protein
VYYFEEYLKRGKVLANEGATFVLTDVVLDGIPKFESSGCFPYFHVIEAGGRSLYDSRTIVKPKSLKKSEGKIRIPCSCRVKGDVKLMFYHEEQYKVDSEMFHCWINTCFIKGDRIRLEQKELDKAAKDKSHKKFPEGFAVELIFRPDDITAHGPSSKKVVAIRPISSPVLSVKPISEDTKEFSDVDDADLEEWDVEKLQERIKEIEKDAKQERRTIESLEAQLEELLEENEALTSALTLLKQHDPTLSE